MTLGDLTGYGKALLVAAMSLALAIPPLAYLLTPAVYYVEGRGLVEVHVKTTRDIIELQCPRFQVTADNMVLSGDYTGRRSVVTGQFVHVLLHGVRAVGQVKVEVAGDAHAAGAVVLIESRNHPVVPNAFIHWADSVVTRTLGPPEAPIAVEVKWYGGVDSPNPPLISVRYNGRPMPKRFTGFGLI